MIATLRGMRRAKNKPGTERFRDERRAGGPRMHGRRWHDHDEVRSFIGDAEMAELDATPELESGGDREGMSKRAHHRSRQAPRSKR